MSSSRESGMNKAGAAQGKAMNKALDKAMLELTGLPPQPPRRKKSVIAVTAALKGYKHVCAEEVRCMIEESRK